MSFVKHIEPVPVSEFPYPFEAYKHVVRPTSEEEGGGFLFTIEDFPGVVSDGETDAEARENGFDAFCCIMSVLFADKKPIPKPLSLTKEV